MVTEASGRERDEIHLDKDHPWPGLISFTEADHSFFFGREREVTELARVIRQETVTVFFGKSGLGKSSILRAGVSPLLRESHFIPVYIRLNHAEEAPPLEDQVEVRIEEVLAEEEIEAPKPVRAETLWEYFHKKDSDWWDGQNRLVRPILIFDQFEELLTVGQSNPVRAARTSSFLAELEDLVENRPPAALLKRFDADRAVARNYDLERTDYRVVLTLREDFLPDLEGLRERLRTIMFNRFRLLPLNGEQAMEVILKPGGHLVEEQVALRIVDFVSSSERSRLQPEVTRAKVGKRAIEPALLSVILQELNNRRIQAGQDKITAELVGNAQAAEIFQDFYRRGLQGMDGTVREFIEDCLLTSSGARNRIAEEDALTKRGMSPEIVTTLIDRRIVQRETTGNVKWLELTHDTLADVVRADRAEHYQRKQVELAAAREAEIRGKLSYVRKLAAAFAGLLVLAAIALGYAVEQRILAERRFQQVRRLADSLMFEIHDSVKDLAGSTPTRRLIVSRALEYLDSLAHDAGGNIALQRELATAYEKIGDIQGNPYSANIGDTDGALTSYRKALQIRESFPPSAITTDTQMELGRTYRALGDIMDQKGDVGQTIREYRRSLQIFTRLAEIEPKNPAVQDELARAYETLADGLGRTANADAERLTTYKKSLTICEELLRQDNSNAKRQRAVAINLLKIGAASDPHQPDAILSIRKGVVILESLAAADPDNGRARREVGWGYQTLGRMLIAAEDYPGAVDSLQKSLAIRERSAAADPQNAQASFDLAGTHVGLADALSATGDAVQAVAHARQGIAIVTALLAADPTNTSYSRNLAIYHDKLGDAFALSGADKNAAVTERLRAWSEARSSYEKAHQIFSDLQAHGTLPPADAAEQPKEFTKRMSDCQEAIKQLTAANSSP